MSIHSHAGLPARAQDRINIGRLVSDYYINTPDVNIVEQRVSFGTSGHRGSSFNNSFNEQHIVAICQALSEYRLDQKFTGPMYIGKDTHALSEPAFSTALTVLIANGVPVVIQNDERFTPTPVISRLIINHNREHSAQADGLIITPSHNPPTDGGIKYNPPHGGPAEGGITKQIEQRANDIISSGMRDVKQITLTEAMESPLLTHEDFIAHYVKDLDKVINIDAIRKANVKIGADPLGGSGIDYWPIIAAHY